MSAPSAGALLGAAPHTWGLALTGHCPSSPAHRSEVAGMQANRGRRARRAPPPGRPPADREGQTALRSVLRHQHCPWSWAVCPCSRRTAVSLSLTGAHHGGDDLGELCNHRKYTCSPPLRSSAWPLPLPFRMSPLCTCLLARGSTCFSQKEPAQGARLASCCVSAAEAPSLQWTHASPRPAVLGLRRAHPGTGSLVNTPGSSASWASACSPCRLLTLPEAFLGARSNPTR